VGSIVVSAAINTKNQIFLNKQVGNYVYMISVLRFFYKFAIKTI
jgi:hypothetical protein